jgi:hypothetical protein
LPSGPWGGVGQAPPEPLRFFTSAEVADAAALFNQLLGQHDEPRMPRLVMADERLNGNRTDGWRYQDLPEDREAGHLTLAYLDKDAYAVYGAGFAPVAADGTLTWSSTLNGTARS